MRCFLSKILVADLTCTALPWNVAAVNRSRYSRSRKECSLWHAPGGITGVGMKVGTNQQFVGNDPKCAVSRPGSARLSRVVRCGGAARRRQVSSTKNRTSTARYLSSAVAVVLGGRVGR